MALNYSQLQYVKWLADRDPFLLQVAIARTTGKVVAPDTGLAGLLDNFKNGTTNILNTIKNIDFQKLANNVTNTAATLANTQAQIKLLKAQTQRAIKGEPPLAVSFQPVNPNFNPYADNSAQTVYTTAQQLNQRNSAGININDTLPWIALAVVGGLLIAKTQQKGRRK